MYLANLLGTYTPSITYPAHLAGIPDALIFFWFFSCIKARKEE